MPNNITLDDLADAAKRILAMPEEQQQGLARKSVLWSIEHHPGCNDAFIAKQQAMDLANVQRATMQLLSMGRIRRGRLGGYEIASQMS